MKNKTTRRTELRRRINDVRRQSPKSYRYGPALKRKIIEYGRECVAEGASIKEVAHELDLSATVLANWLRRAKHRMDVEQTPSERTASSKSMPFETPDPSSPSEPDPDEDADLELEISEMFLIVRCGQVRITAVVEERLRKLLNTTRTQD